MQLIDANVNKRKTYVDSIPPLVHIFITIIMSICVIISGLFWTMAPGIVMSEDVFVNRLPFVFVPKNFVFILIVLLTWGHHVCGIKERYFRKEIIVLWPCAFIGLYGCLYFTSYMQYWQLKSGGGAIDIYPLTQSAVLLQLCLFIAFWPICCCQCVWIAYKGTMGKFLCSSLALILWCAYTGPRFTAFAELLLYFILLAFFSAPGFFGAALQGFITGALLSQCITISFLGLFQNNTTTSLLDAYFQRSEPNALAAFDGF